jgi:hypothetical protein
MPGTGAIWGISVKTANFSAMPVRGPAELPRGGGA